LALGSCGGLAGVIAWAALLLLALGSCGGLAGVIAWAALLLFRPAGPGVQAPGGGLGAEPPIQSSLAAPQALLFALHKLFFTGSASVFKMFPVFLCSARAILIKRLREKREIPD